MTHPTQGIIAIPDLRRHWRTISLLLGPSSCPHRLCAFLAIWRWPCRLSPSRRRRGGRRRQSALRLVRAFIACANRPVRRQQLLLRRRVERPRLVSVRQRVERWFWLDRPLQPQHLWRLRDPAPSSPRRRRFASPGAEPRLPTPRAASAPRRRRRSGVSAFGAAPGSHRFGAGGVPTSPNFHAGAATVSPGFAGGGFHGGLGGGNFHQFHGAGVPHIGAPVSPGFAGGGGFHGLGGATGAPHIGAPSPQVWRRRRFPCRRRRPWAWRGHRSPHWRACLPRFCWRRDFPCRRGFHGFAGGGVGAPTSARLPRQVLLAAGFMASEGPELSRAAARRSDRRHRTSLSSGAYPCLSRLLATSPRRQTQKHFRSRPHALQIVLALVDVRRRRDRA